MYLTRHLLLLVWLGWSASPLAFGHSPGSDDVASRWAAWVSIGTVLGFLGLYLVGSRRRPGKTGQGLCFYGTGLLALVTLLGPLDEWAETSTAAHMVQHMLLMVVIAPLWVLSQPLPQIAAAVGQLGAVLWRPLLVLTQRPDLTAYIHGAVIWFWHLPYFYNLAVADPWWHIVEHACFLVTAGIFWWSVLRASGRRRGWALLALLVTLMHTGFLGAILTFARAPWYGEARDLADQQLAGLIMWVVAAIPYLTAAGWVGMRWVQRLQRRMSLQ